MPEWIELLREGGPLAVVSVIAIYLLLRDRNGRRSSNPGNPGPPLINGRWQQEMRDAQREGNEKLGRIEGAMNEAVGILRLMDDRQQRE